MSLSISSDNIVSLNGLKDQIAGTYVNNATVSATLMQGSTQVTTFTLNYVSNSNGVYEGLLRNSVTGALIPDGIYTVLLTAQTGGFQLVLTQDSVALIAAG